LLVGIGISDIQAEYRGRPEGLAAVPLPALELQPELDTRQPRRLDAGFRFPSAHAPSRGRDIASPHEEHRAFAVAEVQRGMEFAHGVGAHG
jgi:hypothetical protein